MRLRRAAGRPVRPPSPRRRRCRNACGNAGKSRARMSAITSSIGVFRPRTYARALAASPSAAYAGASAWFSHVADRRAHAADYGCRAAIAPVPARRSAHSYRQRPHDRQERRIRRYRQPYARAPVIPLAIVNPSAYQSRASAMFPASSAARPRSRSTVTRLYRSPSSRKNVNARRQNARAPMESPCTTAT